MNLTRREFIKASAAGAALTALGFPLNVIGDDGLEYHSAQCRFCGTGCTVRVGVKGGKVVSVQGDPDSPINEGRVCLKGYALSHVLYGKDRFTHPMVRQKDGSWKKVSWDEALDLIADKFVEYIKKYGKDSVAWYGSGQNTTQEAYAANKLFKGIIGTANVEGNPRLCMASAVGGYLNTFGADEPAGTYDDLSETDCFFIIGSNMAEQHPMLFRRVVNRKEADPKRVKIIVVDPRKNPTTQYADLHLQIRPGYDMHLLNAMAYVIVEEDLVDREHIRHCVFQKGLKNKGPMVSFEEYKRFLQDYAPEKVASLCGLEAEDIRLAARLFARPKHGTISLWTMGLNQRTFGVHMNCQVHNLHLLTGKIGKPGSDSMSLTGQPNACGGTREQGGLTHLLPGHRAVANPKHRKEIAEIWGIPVEWLPKKPTGPAVNMFMRLAQGKIKAIWINTTNPGQSLPNASVYRKAMREAFTVVSDVYPTVTTECASVILPSAMWVEKEGIMGQTDRRSQFIPKLVDPPGEAKPDFWQIKEVARRIAKKLGKKVHYRVLDPNTGKVKEVRPVYGLGFETEEEAWNEYRLCTRGQDVDLWGATYEKLKKHSGGVQWPCPSLDIENRGSAKRYISAAYAKQVFGKTKRRYATGYVTLYDQHLEEKKYKEDICYYGPHPFRKHAGHKAIIRVLKAGLDYEMPDKEYPYVLNTGRVIEHWHTGSMTMRIPLLRDMVPHAYVEIAPEDAKKLGVVNRDHVKIVTRRGEIVLPVWVTDRAQPGMVFVPWFDEKMLINDLTIDDPKSWSGAKEPDYKVCAAKVFKVTKKG